MSSRKTTQDSTPPPAGPSTGVDPHAAALKGGLGASKLWQVAREELGALHIRLLLVRLLLAPLPDEVGGRLRAWALRLAGFNIGHGTIMVGTPTITGGRNLSRQLRVGRGCFFNVGCVLDIHAEVTIGDRAGLGQEAMVLTASHKFGPPGRRFGSLEPLPVKIGEGAWLGARCTILPGVSIGDGAAVAAGAVVTKDVPPNTLVAGVPAKVLRELS